MKPTTNQRNLKNKAGAISNHIATWKQITSDQWILKRILGTTTEAENLKDVPLGESKHYKNNLTDIERTLFRKETKRFSDLGVIQQVRNQNPGYVSSIFLETKRMTNID